jgi:uncharacterized protein YggE
MRQISILSAVLVLMNLNAAAQDAGGSAPPTIVTTGHAIVSRTPDRAFVSVAVETRASTPRQAQQQNAEAMTSVQQRIARAGIDRDAVRTSGYSIQQEFDVANGRRTPRAFVARNGVEVRIDNVDRVGELLDAFVDAGATMVTSIRFDLKDRAGAEREALRLAVADARARAEAMAAGAGRTIDRVIKIADVAPPRFRAPEPMLMAQRAAAAPETTPVESGLIEVQAQVELTVAIK